MWYMQFTCACIFVTCMRTRVYNVCHEMYASTWCIVQFVFYFLGYIKNTFIHILVIVRACTDIMSFEDFLQELSECVGGLEPTACTDYPPPTTPPPYTILPPLSCKIPQENTCFATNQAGFTLAQNIDTVPSLSGHLLFRVKRPDHKCISSRKMVCEHMCVCVCVVCLDYIYLCCAFL